MIKLNLFLAVVAVALGFASAITDEERKTLIEDLKPILDKCRDKFGITREQALAAKAAKDLNKLDPCLYACLFREFGIISDDGDFDADAATEMHKTYFKSEDDLKFLAKIADTCTSVNEVKVTDGAKGCERSKLLLGCFMKEKAGISFFNY